MSKLVYLNILLFIKSVPLISYANGDISVIIALLGVLLGSLLGYFIYESENSCACPPASAITTYSFHVNLGRRTLFSFKKRIKNLK